MEKQLSEFFSIWRIDVNNQKFLKEPVPEKWQYLGGRSLIARILVDEVAPNCYPLGPQNKLIFAPGLLVGHVLSSCDRISIGGKSPLTGGVKEANAGGRTGFAMSSLGIKALIIENKSNDNLYWVLHLSSQGARFDHADEFIGLGVYETTQKLHEKYGKDISIALIGPGGEMGLTAAGIQNTDKDNTPSRIAARGGLGALMGSKGIKAIVIDAKDGDKPPIENLSAFRVAQKKFNKALLGHLQIKTYKDYGTAAMANMCNLFGALPTKNFTKGEFEGIDKISGEFMRDLLLKRGGVSNTTHACMRGCTIQCSNVFGSESDEILISPLEYETIGLMGSNLGIDNLDMIAKLCFKVNDLGLDSIEIGAALGVAAEAGILKFGDGERVLELLEEIQAGTPLGRILGSGASLTGKVLGVERVPTVKGQAMASYDPRAIKGTGVTYATSPQGADHTCGLTIRAKVDHTDPNGQVDLSRAGQINMAGYDSLGACIFTGFGFAAFPESIRDLLIARYGWDVDVDILKSLGKQCLSLEREFNRLAGFTSADDRLPEWMTREALPPTNAVFDIPPEELDSVFNW